MEVDPLAIFKLPRPAFEAACQAAASGVGSEWATIFGGLARLKMPTGDMSVAPDLLRDGCWEPWVTLAVARLVKPKMRCWNIGANVGYYTALMALLTGPEGRVFAIEPNWDLIHLIEESAWGHGEKKPAWGHCVESWAVALCDRDGTTPFYVKGDDLGAGTLLFKPGATERRASSRRLDSAREECCRPIDFILCDAEGVEDRIFLGSKTIADERPIVCLEFSPTKYASPRALWAYFRDLGYASYLIDGTGALVPFDPEVLIREMAWAQLVMLPERGRWSDVAAEVEVRHYGGER